MRSYIALFFLVFIFGETQGQNRQYATGIIDTLAGPEFSGRGYSNDGALKASEFIKTEMELIGLKSSGNGYYHNFTLPVNTFPNSLLVKTDDKVLEPGRDYIVHPGSGEYTGQLTSYFLSKDDILVKKFRKKAIRKTKKKRILVLDTIPPSTSKKESAAFAAAKSEVLKSYKGKALVELTNDLTWSTARNQLEFAHVKIHSNSYTPCDKIALDVTPVFVANQNARNVIGLVPGSEEPDSFILLTGHYDHLGDMGQVYIPGANDNASGIAMILDMARYYALHPPRYTMVFIAFSGEEAGLVGSYHFVNELDQWFDPSHIRFVVNMDLMGSGQDGIMAVNGKIFKEEFDMLTKLNEQKQLLTKVKKRGKAANSDHYFFSENGIPAFFFYLMGTYTFYHEIDDSPENLTLDIHYDKSFLLIREFIDTLQKK